MDSEYFKKQYVTFFKSVPNLKPLGDFVQEGYRVVYENTEVLDAVTGKESDFPIFIQAADLETPFIKKDNLYYVHERDWIRYPKGRVNAGELLIEVKGKIEKVSIVPDDFPKKALVTGSLYKLSVNEKINKYYLLSYLICKYGTAFKDRYKTNLLISFVSKDDLYRIPVPDLSAAFQKKIEFLFLSLFDLKQKSLNIYAQAETLLLDTLGMANFTPSREPVNIKSFKESFGQSGRLDAEHYQHQYDDIEKLIENYNGGYSNISELTSEMMNGAEVREYQEEGVAYLRVGDLKNLDIDVNSVVRIDPTQAASGLNKIKLKAGDVLVSRSGSLAVTAVVEAEWENSLISSHLIRLRVADKRIDPYFLAFFLSVLPGKKQIIKWSNGGVQPEINQPSLNSILIPILDFSMQQQIRQSLLESRLLRQMSKSLLDVAKRAVEIAIEQDEAAALAFIEAEAL